MAVITINLEDQATAGLERVTSQLNATSEGTETLTRSSEALTKAQQEQITIVHKHESSWAQFIASSAAVIDITGKLVSRIAFLTATRTAYAKIEEQITQILEAQATRWAVLRKATEEGAEIAIKRAAGLAGLATVLAGSTVALGAFEVVMARTGKRADDLGNITTNLDRIHAAGKGLVADLQEPLAILFDNAKQWANQLNPIPAIWNEIDASATRSADQMVTNINILRDFVKGTRELEEANARLEKQREKEAPGFEAIRKVNEALQAQEAARQRQAEVASIKTIESIEAEIRKVREKAATMAQAGQDAAQIEKWLLAEITALRQRRESIESDHTAKIEKLAQGYYDFIAASERERARQQREADSRRYDENEALLQKIRDARKAAAEEDHRIETASERSRQLLAELAAQDRRARLERELQDQRKAAELAIATEREKFARLKAARQQAIEKAGINGQDLLQRAHPRQVLKTLQDQARQQAKQKAAFENQDLLRQSFGDSTGPARQAYERKLRQAQDEAAKQAARAFARGQTDPTQLVNAQAQVAGRQLQTMQQNGQISKSTLQATTELLQATAQTQAQLQEQQKQVEQLIRDAQVINQQAQQRANRNRTIAGSL